MTRSRSVRVSNRHDKTTSRPCFSVIVLVLSIVDASSQPMVIVNNSIPTIYSTILIVRLLVFLSKKIIIGRVILIRLHPYLNMADSYQGKS
jgi:hypothetical protein